MNAELEAIKEAWDKNTGKGRDHDTARALADAYVAAHPEQFEQLKNLTIKQVVEAVDTFRRGHLEEQQWLAEVWQIHHFEPQNIGGEYQATVRIPGL